MLDLLLRNGEIVDGGITTGVPVDVLMRTREEFLARVPAGALVEDLITRR